MNNNLTDREREIYNYILNAIKNEGYSPSVRDICNALNMKSTSTVHTYLERLERKGMIQKESGKSRTLRIENEGIHSSSTVRVPILGKVAAGMPILAVENYEGYIDFPRPNSNVTSNDMFALRIQGDSMIEAGILARPSTASLTASGFSPRTAQWSQSMCASCSCWARWSRA